MIPPPPYQVQRRACECCLVLRAEFDDRLTLEQRIRAEVIVRIGPDTLGWDECGWGLKMPRNVLFFANNDPHTSGDAAALPGRSHLLATLSIGATGMVETKVVRSAPAVNPSVSLRVITRSDAASVGALRYFTGAPCKRGHISERSVASSTCLACKAQAALAAYYANPAPHNARGRAYYAQNRDWIRLIPLTPEMRRASVVRTAEWRSANPEAAAALRRNRKRKIRAAEGNHSGEDIKRLFDFQRGKCANCRTSIKSGYHVDHVIPISKGGSNWPKNLQLLCAGCNMRKSALHPVDFARREGRLL